MHFSPWMAKWPLHWYPREYRNQKKQKEHKRKHSYLKEKNTLQWGKKNLNFNNKRKVYFIKGECWGHATLQGNISRQAEHSWESSILGLFKLLTTGALVCKEKAGWDTGHLLCTCAKGWSTEMRTWPWDPSSLESSWSCLTPRHHPGRRDKCNDSFPSAQAWQLPHASSNSQYFQFFMFSEELGIQNAEFFSGKHGDNHLQPSRN